MRQFRPYSSRKYFKFFGSIWHDTRADTRSFVPYNERAVILGDQYYLSETGFY